MDLVEFKCYKFIVSLSRLALARGIYLYAVPVTTVLI